MRNYSYDWRSPFTFTSIRINISSMFLVALLVNSVFTQDSVERKSKSITTVLSAKWESTPLVLELAEYLAEESSDLFWSFFDGINALNPSVSDLETEKQKYDAAIAVANKLVSPSQLRLAKLALSMHSTSPAVRMFIEVAALNDQADCETYVAIAGKNICDNEDLVQILTNLNKYDVNQYKQDIYLVDHQYPTSDNNSLTAVLYGILGSSDFSKKHNLLVNYANRGAINYIVRWNVKPSGKPKVRLSGYGVELQLKSTEYKSQDDSAPSDSTPAPDEASAEEEDENDPQNLIDGFNFGRLKNLFPALRSPLERFRRHLLESSEELAPLKVWQMQGLSMAAAATVLDAAGADDEPLQVLTQISQNFPMHTKSLIHVTVPSSVREEILFNQEVLANNLGLRASEPLLLVSGAQYDAEEVDVMSLLTSLREDIAPMTTLHGLGLPNKVINSLLALDMSEASSSSEYALDIRDTSITWLNDIETDDRFRGWPSSYMELLRPTYPGMLRNLRRNIYNLVIIIDPSSKASLPPLKLSQTLLKHSTPVRVGLVLAPSSEENSNVEIAVRNAFNYVAREKNSNKEAFYLLVQLIESSKSETLTLEHVKKVLNSWVKSSVDLDDLLSEDSEYNFGRLLAKEFFEKLGSDKLPEGLVNGVPISEDEQSTDAMTSADLLEESLVTSLSRHTARFQRAVFRGDINDNDDAINYLMTRPNVMPRLNRRVLSSDANQYLDLSGTAAPSELFTEKTIQKLLSLSGRDMLATGIEVLKYFTKPGKEEKVTQTVWVIGDLNDKETRMLLKSAIDFMKKSRGVRVTFIPNVEGRIGSDLALNKVVLSALATLPSQSATNYITKLLDNEGCHEREDCDIMPELVAGLQRQDWVLKASRVMCARGLGLQEAGARAIVYNARLIGPLPKKETFTAEDFDLLERFTNQAYVDKITEFFTNTKKSLANEVLQDDEYEDFHQKYTCPSKLTEDAGENIEEENNGECDEQCDFCEPDIPELSANAFLKIYGLVAKRPSKGRILLPSELKSASAAVEIPAAFPNEPFLEVTAVLDPATSAAQRLAPLLLVMRKVINCRIMLYMNPQDKNSDMPLKSFYRYVLEPELHWNPDGSARPGAIARFLRMPHSPLLSLELRAPSNWLVECVRSVYDLDNIKLADVDTVVHSEFELEYLIVEGHAWDTVMGTPPRGLQLTLGTKENPDLMDTIVMANLGYFQLKAKPGAWILRLRSGRSAELYDIVGHENTDTPQGSSDIQVLVKSFRSHVVKLRVTKKPGKQGQDLLAEDAESQSTGIWNSITSSFSGNAEEAESADETINIFSVASGHLYERFLRIMMLSVLKHTKSPVKFWFLKNYLSPSFKDILPYMAREYGFQYELVQYQWPRWLQRQKDRQRTIWGYKILFLDVLFPLHVKKIIFVDADQIVRADLKELVDLDLGGAPYGYTPFCDSRKEMEGFRFWKQGYWRNHLGHRRYHISALYVVDLKRFRRIAAGDRLRGQYQALSQDPNSLSNLDQDLPNNMIHQVAIKSLPQEWLWCETWCDEDSKKYAKTIDLCNNPMTKEAKLSAAMRIVPEWKKYDAEVKELIARVKRGLYQHGDQDVEHETIVTGLPENDNLATENEISQSNHEHSEL